GWCVTTPVLSTGNPLSATTHPGLPDADPKRGGHDHHGHHSLYRLEHRPASSSARNPTLGRVGPSGERHDTMPTGTGPAGGRRPPPARNGHDRTPRARGRARVPAGAGEREAGARAPTEAD